MQRCYKPFTSLRCTRPSHIIPHCRVRNPLNPYASNSHLFRTNAASGDENSVETGVERDSNQLPDTATTSNTLAALDSVLGSSDSEEVEDDAKLELWWMITPRQSSPPRRKAMRGGTVSRFFLGDALLKTELRTGRLTALGEELDVPKVQPIFSSIFAASQLIIFSFGVYISLAQGPDSAQEYLEGLAVIPSELATDGWWRLLSCALLQPSALQLLFSCVGLITVGAETEAVIGYSCSILLYLLTVGSTILCGAVLDSHASLALAPAATLGFLASYVGYTLRNPEMPHTTRPKLLAAVLGGLIVAAPSLSSAVGWEPLGESASALVANSSTSIMICGASAGLVLGYLIGPRFHITRELEIPEGSMIIPEDAEEKVVVVDEKLLVSKLGVAGSYLGMLWAGFVVLCS